MTTRRAKTADESTHQPSSPAHFALKVDEVLTRHPRRQLPRPKVGQIPAMPCQSRPREDGPPLRICELTSLGEACWSRPGAAPRETPRSTCGTSGFGNQLQQFAWHSAPLHPICFLVWLVRLANSAPGRLRFTPPHQKPPGRNSAGLAVMTRGAVSG